MLTKSKNGSSKEAQINFFPSVKIWYILKNANPIYPRGLQIWKLGHNVIVVVRHPDYYPRFGFSSARAKGLEVPFPVPDEAFMVLELIPGALKGISGVVKHPSAFDGV
jgi:hypothetical protein